MIFLIYKCMNKISFIEKAKLIHGTKYDYSLLPDKFYTKDKISIICPTHGTIIQEARNHSSGHGCKKCANENSFSNKEIFIKKSMILHNNKYDYCNVEYINNETKVKIICPTHGLFEQKPKHHLYNCGCQKCSNRQDIKYDNRTYTVKDTESFISQSKKIHNKYIYIKTKYKKSLSPVIITCLIHGDFYIKPNKHLMGQGCPICKDSRQEKFIQRYFIENDIKYIRQHRYVDCRNIRPLPFDFYLPDYNMCVEFDGEQHFRQHKIWKNLEYTQKHDQIKNIYCEENNIKLLRIKYNENIIDKLNENIIL